MARTSTIVSSIFLMLCVSVVFGGMVGTPNPPSISNSVIDVGQVAVIQTTLSGGSGAPYFADIYFNGTNTTCSHGQGGGCTFPYLAGLSDTVPVTNVAQFEIYADNSMALTINSIFSTPVSNTTTSAGYFGGNPIYGAYTFNIFACDSTCDPLNYLTTSAAELTINPELTAGNVTPESPLVVSGGSTTLYANPRGGTLTNYTISGFDHPQGLAWSPNGNTIYLVNYRGSSISIINVSTMTTIGELDNSGSGFGCYNEGLENIAISPNGNTIYAANNECDDIQVINTSTGGIINVYNVYSGSAIYGMAISPNGNTLYASFTNDPSPSIGVFNTATGAEIGTMYTSRYEYPQGLAISANGNTLYLANNNNDTVSIFNVSTGDDIGTLTGFDYPDDVAVSPDGTGLYVTNENNDTYSFASFADMSVDYSVGNSNFDSVRGILASSDGTIYVASHTGDTLTAIQNYVYQWDSGSSASCSSDTTPLGTSRTQPVSPSSSTYYCYSVTDHAPTPETAISNTTFITALSGTSVNSNFYELNVSTKSGYPTYICIEGSWDPDSEVVSWTNDAFSNDEVNNASAIGHQTSNNCVVTDDGSEGLGIIGINTPTYTVVAVDNVTIGDTGNQIEYYTIKNSASYPNSYVLITLACGNEQCINVTVPTGCSPIITVGLNGDSYGTAYAALCPYQKAGTYQVNVSQAWSGFMSFAVYDVGVGPSSVTLTPSSQTGEAYTVISTSSSGLYGGAGPYNYTWFVKQPGSSTFNAYAYSNSSDALGISNIATGHDSEPTGLAFSTNYTYLFAADYKTGNVSVIDTATGSVIKNINIPGSCPDNLGTGQDGQYLFVTDYCTTNITVIDIPTLSVVKNLSIASSPCGDDYNTEGPEIATASDTRFGYITNDCNSGVIYVVNTSNATMAYNFSVGSDTDPTSIAIINGGANITTDFWQPCNIALINSSTGTILNSNLGEVCSLYEDVTPDGSQVWFGYSSWIAVLNTSTWNVNSIDLDGVTPTGVGFSSYGGLAYVGISNSDIFGYSGGSVVTVINVTTEDIIKNVTLGANPDMDPWDVVVLPGKSGNVYVSQGEAGNVTVLSASSPQLPFGKLPNVVKQVNTSADSNPWGMALTPNNAFIYAADNNDGDVSVISTATLNVVNTIAIPGSCPNQIGITGNGNYALVTDQCSDNVTVINTQTNKISSRIALPNSCGTNYNTYGPQIAMDPNAPIAYVTDDCDTGMPSNVYVINTGSMSIIDTIRVGSTYVDAAGVVFAKNGTLAYVSGYNNGDYYVINVASNSVINTISGVYGSTYADINPSGSEVWFGYPDELAIFNTSTQSITGYISPPVTPHPYYGSPSSVGFSLNGALAYVGEISNNDAYVSDLIYVYNTTTLALVGNATVGSGYVDPWDVLTNPITGYLYVSQGSEGNVTVMSPGIMGGSKVKLMAVNEFGTVYNSSIATVNLGPTLSTATASAASLNTGQSLTVTSTAAYGVTPYSSAMLLYSDPYNGPYVQLPGSSCSITGSSISCTGSPASSGTYYFEVELLDGASAPVGAISSPSQAVSVSSSSPTPGCPGCGSTGGSPGGTTVTSTTTSSTTTTTSGSTTTIPQITVTKNVTGSNVTISIRFNNSGSTKVNLNNGQVTLIIFSSQNSSGSLHVTNVTLNSTSPSNLTKLNVFNVSLNTTNNTKTTILLTMQYNCSLPSSNIVPYIQENGTWVEIQPFTVNPSSCTVSFSITADPVVGLFESPTPVSSTSTVQPSSTTLVTNSSSVPTPTPSALPATSIAVIVIAVIVVVAGYLVTRNRRSKK